MSVNAKKVHAIRQKGAPKCKKELVSFQGMVNYLEHYSIQLRQVAEDLEELPRNDTLWCLDSKYHEAFKAIKEELIKTAVLAYFDLKADHIIKVNGSTKGMGAVLLQKGRPVIHMSRTLTQAETGYYNIKRPTQHSIWIEKVASLHLWQQS